MCLVWAPAFWVRALWARRGCGRRSRPMTASEAHGLSAFGDLKYPADFQHFDYVNPAAPKGGLFSLIPSTRAYNQSFFTFNSLNAYVLKGEGAQGMDLTFVSLMVRAGDEPDAMYGLAAKSVQISPDKLTYRFTMRPEARFHDGSKLTAQDAAFSLNVLKEKGHPLIIVQLRDMVKAEALTMRPLVVTFAPNRARDVPLYVAGLPIFSKAYYATRPFEESTLDTPLGSGPYKVGKFEVNRFIEFERVKDWWAAGLPVNRGSYNFDVVRYEFYRDRDVAFEGFTGKSYLFREEFTARIWATRYDFPAVKDGRVKRETGARRNAVRRTGLVHQHPARQVQGCARPRGADLRVRFRMDQQDRHVRRLCAHPSRRSRIPTWWRAARHRRKSSSCSSRFAVRCRTRYSSEPFVPPVSDGSGQDRALLRKAQQLLQEAGLPIKDGKRLLPNGEVFSIEFLLDEPSFQPHHATFIKNLGAARHRCQHPPDRRRAIPRPRRGFRFRHHDRAPEHVGDARRQPAALFYFAGRRDQGLLQSCRHRQPRDRCDGRQGHRRRHAGRI